MRVAFAGTPPFAAAALAAILDAGFDVPLVLSQPERPAGRGMQAQAGAVAGLARARGLPLATPASLRPERGAEQAVAALAALAAAAPDILVVAAYGLLLPPAVLALPARSAAAGGSGAINIHASLLPRWRGAAPVARAIEAGDERTGITIMQMDAGLDTGPMLASRSLSILPADSTATLTARLGGLGAELIVEILQALRSGPLPAEAQPAAGMTYAAKIDKREAWLDWRDPAARLACRVRAFDPFPGASARIDAPGAPVLKLWRAHATARGAAGPPGTVLGADAVGVRIACGQGELVVTELQRAGGRRLAAREFVAGTPLAGLHLLPPPGHDGA